ncbi:MAG: Nif3-like dinuclear metal center hexameric protein [Bacteroidales bacterium]|nr:MAG: Nif3-like dinuclear metal center hexameric protein [Bacteroidales bacterium]
MKIKEITSYLDSLVPLSLQESYDNVGLILGDPEQEVTSVLLTLDVTEEVIKEAITLNTGLVISHHPLIFGGLKSITGKTYTERTVLNAIRNNIAVYSAHTNLDNIIGGVNSRIAEKIGLQNTRILIPRKGELRKLATFVPRKEADKVRDAVFNAGAGHIGKYDRCSFNVSGYGSFRGGDDTKPYVGEKGKTHFEEEIRIETIYPKYLEKKILDALRDSHPYEEVAYDIYPLENVFENAGAGLFGEFGNPVSEIEFLKKLKDIFSVKILKHTALLGKNIRKTAICGGSGSYLLNEAIAAGADAFVSADFKYHQFFDAKNRILVADIGHYESEQFTLEIFSEILMKKFPKFAVRFSDVNTNPINYL